MKSAELRSVVHAEGIAESCPTRNMEDGGKVTNEQKKRHFGLRFSRELIVTVGNFRSVRTSTVMSMLD